MSIFSIWHIVIFYFLILIDINIKWYFVLFWSMKYRMYTKEERTQPTCTNVALHCTIIWEGISMQLSSPNGTGSTKRLYPYMSVWPRPKQVSNYSECIWWGGELLTDTPLYSPPSDGWRVADRSSSVLPTKWWVASCWPILLCTPHHVMGGELLTDPPLYSPPSDGWRVADRSSSVLPTKWWVASCWPILLCTPHQVLGGDLLTDPLMHAPQSQPHKVSA